VAATVSETLLAWYDRHARDLPWRARPGAAPPDPYRVWLSEVMLQQTTVAAVKPYFAAFTARWPDVEALAAAREDDVMAAWAGLGYYSRARNLVKCARAVAERGGFPATEADLRELPGLGAYTAAAVAAIATETVGVAAALFPHAWLGLFTDDPEAIATGALYLRIVAPAYAFLGVGLALYFASQGAGRMGWPLLASVVRLSVLALGCTLVAGWLPGNLAALCAVMVAALVALALFNGLPWLRQAPGAPQTGETP